MDSSRIVSAPEQEDLLDLSIGTEEELWNTALAPSRSPGEQKQSTPKKRRLGKRQRQQKDAEDAEAPMPRPKMTLRPLLVTQDDKGFISSKDVRDMFYAILDVAKETEKRQNRMEDTLRIMDARVKKIDKRLEGLESTSRKVASLPGRPTVCPDVPETRYCEICYVEGHRRRSAEAKGKWIQNT
ncbi:hypothetical protein OESDEN_05667 [Oesophagostomum dentatum]|uniref:Uncharacterized protein n=1 Tax=Oesophagostomum dentatum TaxID=61180 RepID=A0A0B1TAW5_OESDE|nr:hypothetical protein OESDEN_05667 [Oesophagostomum dentatum]